MYIISDERADDRVACYFCMYKGFIQIPRSGRTEPAVSGHADMRVFSFADGTAVSCPENRDFLHVMMPDIDIITGKTALSDTYPQNTAYDAVLVGKTLFCLKKYTDPEILAGAQARGIKIVDVKQGYAKCSTVIVSDSAVITADTTIRDAAEANSIDCLFTTNEGVCLPGYDNGFIGGASISTDKDVIFTGDISKHRDFDKIKDFIATHGKTLKHIPDMPLTDYGSVTVF